MNVSFLYAILLYKLFLTRVVHSNAVADMTYSKEKREKFSYFGIIIIIILNSLKTIGCREMGGERIHS